MKYTPLVSVILFSVCAASLANSSEMSCDDFIYFQPSFSGEQPLLRVTLSDRSSARSNIRIGKLELNSNCATDVPSQLCFLSVLFPFFVPQVLPEDGVTELDFRSKDSSESASYRFEFHALETYTLGQGAYEGVVSVNVQVLYGINAEKSRFFSFQYHPIIGVLAFGDVVKMYTRNGIEDHVYRPWILKSREGLNQNGEKIACPRGEAAVH